MNKKVITWLCDTKGWAYDSRVDMFEKFLPDYIHQREYVVGRRWDEIKERVKDADVVVCLYTRYMELLTELKNVVVVIGGMRPFE